MTEKELESRARDLLTRVLKDGPEDQKIVQRDATAANYPDMQRRVSDHFFSVLNPGGEILVFFDPQGNVSGWRDESRKGVAMAVDTHRDALLQAIRSELELDEEAWLGEVKAVVLPPVGWTQQAVVFTKRVPAEQDIVRVWMDPLNLRVIQCLYGAGK